MQDKKLNCAVYTRVSTDMQAEKEYNSCEAQEDRIKSFIRSQENMVLYKIYTDAGYPAATLNRPALQELLRDTTTNKINCVLTYKIDRLTRSSKDFYHLIEHFEKYKVDYISVTERFDTSTPSGRLLRNIMLTFAQFEREMISERTKDKMIQCAEKGLWNGTKPPFGYRFRNKKLIINKKEAEIVKFMFETFVDIGSLAKTYEILLSKGVVGKNGKPFSKNVLHYKLRPLKNPYFFSVFSPSEIYLFPDDKIVSFSSVL